MKNNPIPVHVSLRSVAEGEGDPIQLIAGGTMHVLNDVCELRYRESDPEDPREVLLTMRPGSVLIDTKGAFSSVMLFERNRHYEAFYQTPWGQMHFGLFPSLVETVLVPDAGHIHLRYQLTFDGGDATLHDLTLRWRRRGDAE